MDVVFLAPTYPPEMQQFCRGLAEVGARVYGVGDTPRSNLPAHLKILLVIALGKPLETVELVDTDSDDIKYWRDEQQVHFVPKRPLANILVPFQQD